MGGSRCLKLAVHPQQIFLELATQFGEDWTGSGGKSSYGSLSKVRSLK